MARTHIITGDGVVQPRLHTLKVFSTAADNKTEVGIRVMATDNKLPVEFDFDLVGILPTPTGTQPPNTKPVSSTIAHQERRSVGYYLRLSASP